MNLAKLLWILALAGPAEATEWTDAPLERLGLTDDVRAASTQPALTLPFAARGDRVLVGARLRLDLGPAPAGVDGLEVRVNDEPVGFVEARPGPHVLDVDADLLGDRNTLTLKLLGAERACVPPGTWRFVAGGRLARRSVPLALPDDLGALPLPFVDPDFDTAPVVPVVFAVPPSPDEVRAAALVAGWFGLRTEQPIEFSIGYGALPDTSAVVVATRAGVAALGLPADDRAAVRLLPHPRAPAHKVLVVSGAGAAGLEAAARGFARTTPPLWGAVLAFGSAAPPAPRAAYDAPRWVPDRRDLRLGDLGDRLVHAGTAGGTLRVAFRVAPDLFPWPDAHVPLDLVYRVRAPAGAPPRLAVQLGDRFVAALPVEGDAWRTARLRLQGVRGRAELRVHVEPAACEGPIEVEISPDSRLRLAGVPHFTRLPDVDRFVFDGFPFTRRADLGETALVLPDAPRPEEVGAALSWIARFATVTGVVAERLTVLPATGVEPGLDADLLVVEAADRAGAWRGAVPIELRDGALAPQAPGIADWWSSLAAARWPAGDRARAARWLEGVGPAGAITGAESPLLAGRALVLVTAATPAALPDAPSATGVTERTGARGDLLLVAGDRRALFALGAGHDVGAVPGWTRVRWFLASHWVLLFAAIFAAAFGSSLALRRLIARNHARRLADPGEGGPCPPA